MPAEMKPIVSVIIPTYNRMDSLLLTLESLSQQTYPADRFEVIVVDDGGTDGTGEIAQAAYPFKLLYCRQTNQGSAAARNHGAQESCGDILMFIDDDMTLDSKYLAEITKKTLPGTLAMGLWQPYKPSHPSPFSRTKVRQMLAQVTHETQDEEVSFAECTSNNLALRRTDFMRLGMWRDVLGDGPTLWGDVEFGYRAWKEGCCFLRVAAAKLIHRDQHMTDLVSATKRAYHVSSIVQPLFALHPEIPEHIPMFHDKGPIDWRGDPPSLIARKILRQMMSSTPSLFIMERTVPILERRAPASKLLVLLYRWIVSAYIYKGYRQGLRDLVESTVEERDRA